MSPAQAQAILARRDYLPWADVEEAKAVLGIVEPTAAEMMADARRELERRRQAGNAPAGRSGVTA